MQSVRVLSSVAKITRNLSRRLASVTAGWAASELILEARAGFREVQKQGQDPSERRVSIGKKRPESLLPSKPNKMLRTAG